MEPPKVKWCIRHNMPAPTFCILCFNDGKKAQPGKSSDGEEFDASSKGGKAGKSSTEEPATKDPLVEDPSSNVGEPSTKEPSTKDSLAEDSPLKIGEPSTKEPSIKDSLAEDPPFNAALTATIPAKDLLPPPKDLPAVKVAYISKEIGFGLVAARDFAAGEFIFHERPLMEATYNGHHNFARLRSLIESQYQAYRAVRNSSADLQKCFATAFPQFAARMGVHFQLPEAELLAILNRGIACNMIHGRLDVSSVSSQNCQEIWKNLKPYGASFAEMRDFCHDFFKNYAFQSRNVGQQRGIDAAATVPAYIYLLASLINHRCQPKDSMVDKLPKLFARLTKKTSDQNTAGTATAATTGGAAPPVAEAPSDSGPNCTWQISPGGLARFIHNKAIAVRAKRSIRQGEELTWDYGRKVGFKCLCRTCKK